MQAADLLDNDTDWLGHGWDGSGIRMGVWAGGRLGGKACPSEWSRGVKSRETSVSSMRRRH